MTPKSWRTAQNLSLAAMAAKIGITGRNPAATYMRWERGDLRPPDWAVMAVYGLTGGEVSPTDWIELRLSMSRRPEVSGQEVAT